MEVLTYISNQNELGQWQEKFSSAILIAPKNLSKRGNVSLEQTNELLQKSKVPVFIEWDILHTENELREAIEVLNSFDEKLIAGARVLDVGACEYILEEKKNWKIQFLAESGNHNIHALNAWKDYLGDRLDRLVLSKELPFHKWGSYIQSLDGKVEWQVLGPIELFYSPRKLINGKEAVSYTHLTLPTIYSV